MTKQKTKLEKKIGVLKPLVKQNAILEDLVKHLESLSKKYEEKSGTIEETLQKVNMEKEAQEADFKTQQKAYEDRIESLRKELETAKSLLRDLKKVEKC